MTSEKVPSSEQSCYFYLGLNWEYKHISKNIKCVMVSFVETIKHIQRQLQQVLDQTGASTAKRAIFSFVLISLYF